MFLLLLTLPVFVKQCELAQVVLHVAAADQEPLNRVSIRYIPKDGLRDRLHDTDLLLATCIQVTRHCKRIFLFLCFLLLSCIFWCNLALFGNLKPYRISDSLEDACMLQLHFLVMIHSPWSFLLLLLIVFIIFVALIGDSLGGYEVGYVNVLGQIANS